MNIRLQQLIEQKEDHFNDWIEKLNKNSNMWNSPDNYTEQERLRITIDTAHVLGYLADMFIKHGNFKDVFEHDYYNIHLYGPEILINAKKTGISFRMGIDLDGVYINNNLNHPENIRYMDEDFWSDIIALTKYNGFELVGMDRIGNDVRTKYPELSYQFKGVVFKIFRRYFFSMTEYGGDIDNFGEFKVSLGFDNEFIDIIEQGSNVFKLMYKLSYSLWKVEDLKKKKGLKHG